MKNKAIFKFNSGNLALLCSNCRKIIKVGNEFTETENKALRGKINLPPQYCKNCKKNEKVQTNKPDNKTRNYL